MSVRPESTSEATRYLCIAARADESFGSRLIGELLYTDLRAVAPSVGIDLRPVLSHGLAARTQWRDRDISVLLVMALSLLIAPVFSLVSWFLLLPLLGFVGKTAQNLGKLRVLLAMPVVIIFYFVFLQVSLEDADTGYWLGSSWFASLAALVLFGLFVRDRLRTRQALVGELRRDRFPTRPLPNPQTSPALQAKIDEVCAAQYGNVTVYGEFTPFIGNGMRVSDWSFALPTVVSGERPHDAENTVAIDPLELIEHVRSRLALLGDPAGRATDGDRLHGLTLDDRVYVTGTDLAQRPELLPTRDRPPVHQVSSALVGEIAGAPRGAARHYLCASVPSWGGEVVATTFLHFSTDGRMLYLECACTILVPLARKYHEVDRLTDQVSPEQILWTVARAATGLGTAVFGTPLRLLRGWWRDFRAPTRHLGTLAQAREDLGFNYGAQLSIRELGSLEGGLFSQREQQQHLQNAFGISDRHPWLQYQNYFQVMDGRKHLKLVERHVLAAILDFLDDKGVDTTEFRSRQMTILNQGIIQTGGVNVVGNQAVGEQATANQQLSEQGSAKGA
ncbi:hypothetical protein D5S17_16100 [Pseudonocardiaceae bacterium YIM PH 21723]|nr:hypothetical protein D5S17_16100 [Pseudonocardiaceae bacterium YIM PH 21723]